jgi:hypothetical protein
VRIWALFSMKSDVVVARPDPHQARCAPSGWEERQPTTARGVALRQPRIESGGDAILRQPELAEGGASAAR